MMADHMFGLHLNEFEGFNKDKHRMTSRDVCIDQEHRKALNLHGKLDAMVAGHH